MFNWLRRRRLSAEARKTMMIIAARSQEAIVETHVANAMHLYRALADEVDVERALELYAEMMSLPESLAAAVSTRLLARAETPPARGPLPPVRRLETGFAEEAKG